MDYEQLYYDSLYENKKLKDENDDLKEEIIILTQNKDNKTLHTIIQQLNEYFKYKYRKE